MSNRMIVLWLVIGVVAIVAGSCDLLQPAAGGSPYPLTGKWLWSSTCGGIGGWVTTPPPGMQSVTTISATGLWQVHVNDTLRYTAHYVLGRGKSIYSGDSADVVTIRDSLRVRTYVLLQLTDTLVLGDNMYDGYTHGYARIRQ